MSLVNSPSPQYDSEGLPPETGQWLRRARRLFIAALAAVAVGLLTYVMLGSRVIEAAAGTGVVTGTVVDAAGQPLMAQVFVAGTERFASSSAAGTFTISNVAAGRHTLWLAAGSVDQRAAEVTVTAGQTLNAGTLTFAPGP